MRPRSNLWLAAAVTTPILSAMLLCGPAFGQGQPARSGSSARRERAARNVDRVDESPGDLPGGFPSRETEVRRPSAPPDPGAVPLEEVLDPAAYVVGPGDLLAVNFWGAQSST